MERIIDDFVRQRLLVTGDVVLDEYVWGEVDRVSPEAPVPVVARVREGRVLLDVRTLLDDDDAAVEQAIAFALGPGAR